MEDSKFEMKYSLDNMKYSLDELYGDLYKCVSCGENEYVIQRPFNTKFKQLERNLHLMYRKKIYYIKSAKYANTKKKDKCINLNIRKVDPKH